MKYTVTETPARLFSGAQGSVTLSNYGPGTVYLDSNTSISTDNALPLAPTESTTWQLSKPLWVRCATGETSQLYADNAGGLIVKPYSAIARVLTNIATPSSVVGPINVGAYETVVCTVQGYGFPPDGLIPMEKRWTLHWLDENKVEILSEVIARWSSAMGNGIDRVTFSVKGSYLSIDIPSEKSIQIQGTTRKLGTTSSMGPTVYSVTQPSTDFTISKGNILCEKVSSLSAVNPYYLPSWGREIRAHFYGSVTTAGFIYTRGTTATNPFYSSFFLAAGANQHWDAVLYVPNGAPVIMESTAVLNSAVTNTLNLIWMDYD